MKPARLLGYAAAFVGMVIVVLIGLHWGDEPPPDDADLLPPPRVVEEGDDGYPILVRAIAAFRAVEDRDRLADFTPDGSDDAWLRGELENNAEARRLLAEAVGCPVVVLPEFSVENFRTGMSEMRDMARLEVMGARVKLRDPATQREGLDQLLQVFRFGRQYGEGGGAAIDLLISLALQGNAMTALREEIPHLRLDPEQTREFLRALESERLPRNAFAETLRGEYVFTKETYASYFIPGASPKWYEGFGYTIKPNKALRMAGDLHRRLISLVEEPVYRNEDWPHDEVHLEKTLPFENAVGRSMVAMAAPTISRVFLSAYLTEANLGSTQLLVALSGFERAEGELPESLEELVGVWIDSIPVDPFSGKELRYSKPHRLVFSVGPEREREPSSSLPGETDVIRSFVVPEPER